VDISPKTFTGAETSLTITGTDAAGGAIYDAEIHVVLKDDTSPEPNPLLVLNVMVLPKRGPISVGVYHIEDGTSPDTEFASSPAVAKANAASVVQVLNDVFKQAGVTFVVHGSSGDYDVPYDKKQYVWNESLQIWMEEDGQDGRLGWTDEDLLESQNWAAEIPIFFVKMSGEFYPEQVFREDPLFARGVSSSVAEGPPEATVFLLESGGFVELVTAHEVGHILGLSTADNQTQHHDPPYPDQVISDVSNLNPPLPPTGHLSEPNAALMQGGAPVDGLLPWPWGRWMRHQDWRAANQLAGDHF